MSEESENQTDPILRELQRYEAGGEIVPGSAAILHNTLKTGLQGRPPEVVAETIARRMEYPGNARYRNPEYVERTAPNGAPASELRTILHRYSDMLQPGMADDLASRWAADLARYSGPRLAQEVVKRLHSRDSNPYLATPIPPTRGEAVVMDLLAQHFGDVPHNAEKLARELAREIGGRSEREKILFLAGRLRLPRDDPRRRGLPREGLPRTTTPPPKSFPKPRL